MSSSPTCDYEAERAKRIAENMRRLAELGVKEVREGGVVVFDAFDSSTAKKKMKKISTSTILHSS